MVDLPLMTVMGSVPSFVQVGSQANWRIDVHQFGKILERTMGRIKK